MMDLLHITEIRRGRDGSNKSSRYYANYDESKANPVSESARSAGVEERQEGDDRRDVVEQAARPRSSKTSTARSTAASRRRRPK